MGLLLRPNLLVVTAIHILFHLNRTLGPLAGSLGCFPFDDGFYHPTLGLAMESHAKGIPGVWTGVLG